MALHIFFAEKTLLIMKVFLVERSEMNQFSRIVMVYVGMSILQRLDLMRERRKMWRRLDRQVIEEAERITYEASRR